jgi:hypothetical protein
LTQAFFFDKLPPPFSLAASLEKKVTSLIAKACGKSGACVDCGDGFFVGCGIKGLYCLQ